MSSGNSVEYLFSKLEALRIETKELQFKIHEKNDVCRKVWDELFIVWESTLPLDFKQSLLKNEELSPAAQNMEYQMKILSVFCEKYGTRPW